MIQPPTGVLSDGIAFSSVQSAPAGDFLLVLTFTVPASVSLPDSRAALKFAAHGVYELLPLVHKPDKQMLIDHSRALRQRADKPYVYGDSIFLYGKYEDVIAVDVLTTAQKQNQVRVRCGAPALMGLVPNEFKLPDPSEAECKNRLCIRRR